MKGVWLQAVLLSAVQAGTIELNDYSDALVYLSRHRHGYVSLGIGVVLSTFQRDNSDEFVRLQALCAYIGNKDAEPFSHIHLAAAFINQVWSNGSSHGFRVRKATNMVFSALLYEHRGNQWANWAALLFERLTGGPRAALRQWCRGHFLPLAALEDAVGKIRNYVQERE